MTIVNAHLIWSDFLSRGRVRRPSPNQGAGASCFVVVVLASVSFPDARSD